MELIFAAKFKFLFIILLSVSCFGYFKYAKKTNLPSYVAIIIGLFFLALGWASVGSFFSTRTLVEALFLNSDIPFMMDKMFMLGYSFVLLGLMSFVDELLEKVSKNNRKKA